jgi:hypothetical protein
MVAPIRDRRICVEAMQRRAKLNIPAQTDENNLRSVTCPFEKISLTEKKLKSYYMRYV